MGRPKKYTCRKQKAILSKPKKDPFTPANEIKI